MATNYQHTPGQIPYRRGIFQEDMEYNSLTISEMSDKDRKYVLKQLIKINSADDVDQLIRNCYTSQGIPKSEIFWSYNKVDLHGRVGILKYKGIEVALFIQRQLTKKRIDTEHPISEVKLKDPKDAWMRFDLFGVSAQQSRRPTVELIAKLQRQVESLEQKLATQVAINEQLEASKKRYDKKNKHKEKKRREASGKRKDDKVARRKEIKRRHRSSVKRPRKSR